MASLSAKTRRQLDVLQPEDFKPNELKRAANSGAAALINSKAQHLERMGVIIRKDGKYTRNATPQPKQNPLKTLKAAGIPHSAPRFGLVKVNGIIDFYPSTEAWRNPKDKAKHYGVQSLIAHIKGG